MENNCIVENIAFLPDEHPVYKYNKMKLLTGDMVEKWPVDQF